MPAVSTCLLEHSLISGGRIVVVKRALLDREGSEIVYRYIRPPPAPPACLLM